MDAKNTHQLFFLGYVSIAKYSYSLSRVQPPVVFATRTSLPSETASEGNESLGTKQGYSCLEETVHMHISQFYLYDIAVGV